MGSKSFRGAANPVLFSFLRPTPLLYPGSALASDGTSNETVEWKGRVSVSIVAFFTLAMAAATGLDAKPFFFVELDSQWAGICNGMAAGDGFHSEVSMLDIKGAGAAKVILVIGIMTFHSFVEGSSIGVSFAGSKGLSKGILVTSKIAVHK
ncbi:putative zinc transporter [Abeliophyllum distichum]|uniref:Zinc transporter n=1 Tax=Abeliophyllum distichum TaxID=126358 RepID=A0ABD1QT09_9LAMI